MSVLTPRERQVLALAANGLSNGEIARELYLGTTTVKTHMTRVLMALKARNRTHAALLGIESGDLVVRDGQVVAC